MNTALDLLVEQHGKATAIVILQGATDPGGSSVDPNELDPYFIAGPDSGDTASPAEYHGKASYFPRLGVMIGTVDRQGLTSLQSDARVYSIHAAPTYRLLIPKRIGPAVHAMGIAPGLAMLHVDRLWAQGFTGNGVKIGHLDTGVDTSQSPLSQAVDSFVLVAKNGVPTAADPGDACWHGTHTAGILAARQINGRPVVGVAPGAVLESAVVGKCDDVDEPICRLVGAMEWALNSGAQIINMSVGVNRQPDDQAFTDIINIIMQKGVLLVCASGDSGPDTSMAPANYPGVLSVGACDDSKGVWSGSSSQTFPGPPYRIVPDLLAPGVNIVSTVPTQYGAFKPLTGTSMAAPHISGLAALLMEARPHATAAQIQAAIFRSCLLNASISPSEGNRGIPDAAVALNYLP